MYHMTCVAYEALMLILAMGVAIATCWY